MATESQTPSGSGKQENSKVLLSKQPKESFDEFVERAVLAVRALKAKHGMK